MSRSLSKAERAHYKAKPTLPYGVWTCDDGREVLFNRDYVPFLQRCPGGLATDVEERPNRRGVKWIPWVSQSWFFDDGTSYAERLARGAKVLADFHAGRPIEMPEVPRSHAPQSYSVVAAVGGTK